MSGNKEKIKVNVEHPVKEIPQIAILNVKSREVKFADGVTQNVAQSHNLTVCDNDTTKKKK